MRLVTAVLLTVLLFFWCPVSAEAGIGEKVIGSTIKGAVKVYVAITNIETKKKQIIAKLKKADARRYKEKYARLYVLLKDLPPHLKATYKVTPHMNKEQMIKNVESMDKKAIYRAINSIPDKTVMALFKQYRSEMSQKEYKGSSDLGDSE